MTALFERYRPHTWDDVVGQDKAVKCLRAICTRGGFGGRAYWLSGPSGTGKTTLARLVAADMAETWHITEIDAQDCTLDLLRSMEGEFRFQGLGAKTGKAWIINEAHGMRGPVLSRFLTLLEALPAHCAVIFTTTNVGQASLFEDYDDAHQFLSRCLVVKVEGGTDWENPVVRAFAERARSIAQLEGLDGRPIEAYVKLALACKVNLRRMLSEIEAGCMMGSN